METQAKGPLEVLGQSKESSSGRIKPSLRRTVDRMRPTGKTANFSENHLVEEVEVQLYSEEIRRNQFKGESQKCCLLF